MKMNKKRPANTSTRSGARLLRIELLEQRQLLAFSVTSADVLDVTTSTRTLVSSQAVWFVDDDGTNQEVEWKESNFDDSTWKIGAQPLGYSGSFANISRLASLVRCGPTPLCNADNFATTYFRLPFPAIRPETIVGLSANLWRNQGTAVYLNGVEIYRDDNLPTGPSFDDFTTAPLDGPETVPFTVDPTLLLEGRNLLAVETHLASPEDSELVFALSLTSRVSVESAGPAQLEIEFDQPVDPTSVDPTDLEVDGIPATGVSVVGLQAVVFDLPELVGPGPLVARIGAGSIWQDNAERTPLEAFELPFRIDVAPQYLVKHNPRLQPGNTPLAPFAGSETDQVDVLWQTVPASNGTSDRFTVEFRTGAESWQLAALNDSIDTGFGGRIIHSATIDGLEYDTDYEYRVRHWRGNVVINTYQHTFHTRLPAGSEKPFSFAAYGDSAEIIRVNNFRGVQAQINGSESAFALGLGDNVYPRGRHPESDARFDPSINPQAAQWIASHIDYAAIGNHAISAPDGNEARGKPFREFFSNPLPRAGVNAPAQPPPWEPPEHNYSFDYGNVHFVTFDTNSISSAVRLDALLSWVEADLAASDATWKIVFGHHPVAFVPDKVQRPSDNYYQQVVSRLRAVGVDVLLMGHSHTFSWTKPLLGQVGGVATFVDDTDKVYTKGAGLIQVVSGVGGRTLRPGSYSTPGQEAIAAGFTTQTAPPVEFGYAQFDVSPTELKMSYVTDTGAVIDSFSIVSQANQYTFQQGVNGYQGTIDTTLREGLPFSILSVTPLLAVVQAHRNSVTGESHTLMRFDDLFGDRANQIPSSASIVSAHLELSMMSGGDSIRLHRMLQPWTDTNTWSSTMDGIQADGVEAAVTPDAVAAADVVGNLSIDVTSSLRAWAADPATNFGWAILPDGPDTVVFGSADGATPPRLVVEVLGTDTTGPTARILDVEPNPRVQDVDRVTLVFNEAVTGLDISDIFLSHGADEDVLPDSASLVTAENVIWTIGNLSDLTDQPGVYELRLATIGSGIENMGGNALVGEPITKWTDIRQPGDANLDRLFDQRDIVRVLQAGEKYLSGQPAAWREGDWNGDGVFDTRDIVAALQTGNYLQGPYAAEDPAGAVLAVDWLFHTMGSG